MAHRVVSHPQRCLDSRGYLRLLEADYECERANPLPVVDYRSNLACFKSLNMSLAIERRVLELVVAGSCSNPRRASFPEEEKRRRNQDVP